MLPVPFNKLPEAAHHHLTIAKGGRIFRQDDPARGPYFVLDGMVELIRHSRAGIRVVLHRARRGETFAEANLFSDSYHCDCIAMEDCRLIRLDKSVILSRLDVDPEFSQALLARFAQQVQTYRRHQELLAIKRAPERVLAALADIGQNGTVMDFAAAIGLSHEATYRALSDLVASGDVRRIARGRYELADQPR